MYKIFFLAIFCGFLLSSSFGQGHMVKEGNEYYKNERYDIALNFYNRIPEDERGADILFKLGDCKYNLNQYKEAIYQFSRAYKKGYNERSIYLKMARCQHFVGEYKLATRLYKRYLRTLSSKDNTRSQIIQWIKQCAYAIDHAHDPDVAFVENLGDFVNSIHDEVHPVFSPNYTNKFYYSSNRGGSTGGLRNSKGLKDEFYGQYAHDMYSTSLVNGDWEYPTGVNELINTARHEVLLDFSRSGDEVFFLRSKDLKKGTIIKDSFRNDIVPDAVANSYISPVVGELEDRYLNVFDDSTFVFASKRAGGFGGYDLYMTIQREGIWSDPINLGDKINSPADEIAPFLTNDGRSLYFSTDRKESFGGFDIYNTNYSVEGAEWSDAQNLGAPINSANDDLNIAISNDGNTAIFNSDRAGGSGGTDLYIAYLKKQVQGQLISSSTVPYIDQLIANSIQDEVVKDSTVNQIPLTDSEVPTEQPNEPEIIQERTVVIKPLYYSDDDNVFTPQNNVVLKDLVDIMRIFPELRVSMTCYSLQEGLPEFDLYFSIKRAETVKDYLITQGIDDDRILIRGVGSNYPFVKKTFKEQKTNIAKQINRRIEIELLDINELPITVNYENPTVVDYLKDNKYQIYRTLIDDVVFRVKIAKVSQLFRNEVLNTLTDVIIDEEDGQYLYTVGLYSDFFTALSVHKLLVDQGFDSNIRIYKGGVILNAPEIEELAKSNKEVQRYLSNRN